MAFKAVFGSHNVGSGDGQRNLGIHSLRYSYILGAVARQVCGKKNATSHQMREDGRMSRPTLSGYLGDACTRIEFAKSQGITWGHLLGFDYRPMYIKNPGPMGGSTLPRQDLLSLAVKLYGEDFLWPEGFCELQNSLRNGEKVLTDYAKLYQVVLGKLSANSFDDGNVFKPGLDLRTEGESMARQLRVLADLMDRARVVTSSDPPHCDLSNHDPGVAQAQHVAQRVTDCAPEEGGVGDAASIHGAASSVPATVPADPASSEGADNMSSETNVASSGSQNLEPAAQPRVMTQRQFQTLVSASTGARFVRSELSRSAPAPHQPTLQAFQRAREEPTQRVSQKAYRDSVMKDFSRVDYTEQLAKLESLYTNIPEFKKIIDENLHVTADLVPHKSCKQYVKKRLRPFIRCFHGCCKKDETLFYARNEDAGFVFTDRGRRRLRLSKWEGSCGCPKEDPPCLCHK